MRKTLLLTALILVLGVFVACAEHYTSIDTIYYHAMPNCRGGAYEMALDDADTCKYPCPVCVRDEARYDGIELFDIGGLTVMRMPDEWMTTQTDITEIFALTKEEKFTGTQALEEMAEYLHGDAYMEFASALTNGGNAETMVYSEGCYCLYDKSSVSYIGAAQYRVFDHIDAAPGTRGDEDEKFDYRFFCGPARVSDGVFAVHISDEWDDYFTDDFVYPSLTVIKDDPVWSGFLENRANDGKDGGADLKIYKSQGFYLLTARISGLDALSRPLITMSFSGMADDLHAKSVKDGDDALCGVVVSEGQAALIMEGKYVSLSYTGYDMLELNYMDSPYAILTIESNYDHMVIDDKGEVVLPETNTISRVGNVFCLRDWESEKNLEAAGLSRIDSYSYEMCSVCDLDSDTELLRGNYLVNLPNTYRGFYEYSSFRYMDFFQRNTEVPILRLQAGRDDGQTARFTISGNAKVYISNGDDGTEAHERLSTYSDTRINLQIPDNCFLAVFEQGPWPSSNYRHALVIWSLDGSEPLTPEELGIVGSDGKPLFTRVDQIN